MLKKIKHFYNYVITYDFEFIRLTAFVKKLPLTGDTKILDVGCGYGRYLRYFHDEGYDVIGVEENNVAVEKNQQRGLNCVSVEKFSQSTENFDLIILSHIIEHFSPSDLKEFMDFYLDRLKIGGHLIIATPLMSPYFYDDFDHIKPYQPLGIMMVFGRDQAQVQYYARNKLELKDIWFRRGCYRLNFVRSNYTHEGFGRRVFQLVTFISALIFYLLRGRLGKIDGWVGVFEKVEENNA